eukprot:CAMPEP_0119021104 /NCGR_PEP_ID=MMETSP1176-20130426/25317_1 /TAXON_ID=265551 /ORGANISM="Synedropsis recta cf, Strain CCMP1620" /LENGTH=58 /DNA_ID=CAMNT_0006975639 /DNA_START=92 /DNA_END=268 /DNA_ORIENTATION=+
MGESDVAIDDEAVDEDLDEDVGTGASAVGRNFGPLGSKTAVGVGAAGATGSSKSLCAL